VVISRHTGIMNNSADGDCRGSVTRRITSALIASGYTSLDAQALALGLRRSTTWYLIKSKHKVGRLSGKVRERMLANPNLPPLVRKELEQSAFQAELRNSQEFRDQAK
jgi:hypothetical protein